MCNLSSGIIIIMESLLYQVLDGVLKTEKQERTKLLQNKEFVKWAQSKAMYSLILHPLEDS